MFLSGSHVSSLLCLRLLGLGLLQRLRPVQRCQLQDLGGRPAGQQAQEVAQVAQRLDAVQPAAGQQRDPERVDLGSLVAAAKQPVAAAQHLAAQSQLAAVIVQGQSPVGQESPQGLLLIARVAQRVPHRGLLQDVFALLLAVLEEGIDQRARFLLADAQPVLGRGAGQLAFQEEQRGDVAQGGLGSLGVGVQGLDEVAAAVAPAAQPAPVKPAAQPAPAPVKPAAAPVQAAPAAKPAVVAQPVKPAVVATPAAKPAAQVAPAARPAVQAGAKLEPASMTPLFSRYSMGTWLAALPVMFLVVFFVVPSLLLFVISFFASKPFEAIPDWNIDNYVRIFAAKGFWLATLNGLSNGFFTATISVLMAFPVAWSVLPSLVLQLFRTSI